MMIIIIIIIGIIITISIIILISIIMITYPEAGGQQALTRNAAANPSTSSSSGAARFGSLPPAGEGTSSRPGMGSEMRAPTVWLDETTQD